MPERQRPEPPHPKSLAAKGRRWGGGGGGRDGDATDALGDKMNEKREQRNARKDLGNADIEVNRRYRSKEP